MARPIVHRDDILTQLAQEQRNAPLPTPPGRTRSNGEPDPVTRQILTIAHTRGWSHTTLTTQACVSSESIRALAAGSRRAVTDVAERLAAALGCRIVVAPDGSADAARAEMMTAQPVRHPSDLHRDLASVARAVGRAMSSGASAEAVSAAVERAIRRAIRRAAR